MELRTTSFVVSTGVASSDFVIHNRIQVLSIPVLLLFPERITSAPRNLDWRMEDNTQKLTTVCLPYIKGLAERIQKICSLYDIGTVFTSGSTLRGYLFWVKPPTEFNMTKNYVYSIPCSCGKICKGETGRPLKVRLEHQKAVVRREIEKSGMADHI